MSSKHFKVTAVTIFVAPLVRLVERCCLRVHTSIVHVLHSDTRLTSVNPVIISTLWLFAQSRFLSVLFSVTAATCSLQRSWSIRGWFTQLFVKTLFIVCPVHPEDRRGRADILRLRRKDLPWKTPMNALQKQLVTKSDPGLPLEPNLHNSLRVETSSKTRYRWGISRDH